MAGSLQMVARGRRAVALIGLRMVQAFLNGDVMGGKGKHDSVEADGVRVRAGSMSDWSSEDELTKRMNRIWGKKILNR